MNTTIISRAYLESLSSADLVSLADEYDIDIPEDFNRRFMIAELLDVVADCSDDANDFDFAADTVVPDQNSTSELPKSYNETVITVLLRNPAWAYVYWDISDADIAIIEKSKAKELNLRLVSSSASQNTAGDKAESFELPAALTDREQYVLLPAGKETLHMELVLNADRQKARTLAVSSEISIPHGCPEFKTAVLTDHFPPMLALSGFRELVLAHYQNHRQSFS